MHSHKPTAVLILCLFLLVLMACGAPLSPTNAPILPSSATPIPPGPSATPPLIPPPTSTLPPTETSPASPSPTTTIHQDMVSPTPTLASLRLKVYLIAIGDNGLSGPKIGCDDSAVPVEIEVPYTTGVLRAALNYLLAIPDQYYGQSGLYNALYQSDLTVSEVNIEDGLAAIHLEGTLLIGGMCDAPRVQAQIEQTALQFSTVQQVAVYLNGEPLKDALSGR